MSAHAIARVRARIDALYGDHALEADEGIVQVAAVFEHADVWRVLKIGEASPHSTTDRFVLDLSRARADAIVVTGKILRDEPALRYALEGEGGAGLAAWRRDALHRASPPALLVLSRTADLDPEHPALHGWATPIVITGSEGAARASGQGLRAVALAEPSLRAAIEWARAELSARTISIEAGPSTAHALYDDDPPMIDELMLSEFRGDVPLEVRGAVLVGVARARALLPHATAVTSVTEPSGPWQFSRLRR